MVYTDEQLRFLADHRWGVLATERADGSPQQAMVGYTLDGERRILISTQAFTAKWRNALREPRVAPSSPLSLFPRSGVERFGSRGCPSPCPTAACTWSSTASPRESRQIL